MAEVDLAFIARKLDAILHEVADIRDDLLVVRANLSLIETAVESLHRRVGRRLADRIDKLGPA